MPRSSGKGPGSNSPETIGRILIEGGLFSRDTTVVNNTERNKASDRKLGLGYGRRLTVELIFGKLALSSWKKVKVRAAEPGMSMVLTLSRCTQMPWAWSTELGYFHVALC